MWHTPLPVPVSWWPHCREPNCRTEEAFRCRSARMSAASNGDWKRIYFEERFFIFSFWKFDLSGRDLSFSKETYLFLLWKGIIASHLNSFLLSSSAAMRPMKSFFSKLTRAEEFDYKSRIFREICPTSESALVGICVERELSAPDFVAVLQSHHVQRRRAEVAQSHRGARVSYCLKICFSFL